MSTNTACVILFFVTNKKETALTAYNILYRIQNGNNEIRDRKDHEALLMKFSLGNALMFLSVLLCSPMPNKNNTLKFNPKGKDKIMGKSYK